MNAESGLAPAHPGEVLRDMWADIGLRQGQFAEALGGSPNLWMNLQQARDLWKSEKTNRPKYATFATLTPGKERAGK